jgi:hypothetical protein
MVKVVRCETFVRLTSGPRRKDNILMRVQ